ncbi:MAG: hypothetical protein FJY28_04810 [Betaproteobacteria bacterium]|nr:hypothetical protein [Betaproteobacteria bacterium]
MKINNLQIYFHIKKILFVIRKIKLGINLRISAMWNYLAINEKAGDDCTPRDGQENSTASKLRKLMRQRSRMTRQTGQTIKGSTELINPQE